MNELDGLEDEDWESGIEPSPSNLSEQEDEDWEPGVEPSSSNLSEQEDEDWEPGIEPSPSNLSEQEDEDWKPGVEPIGNSSFSKRIPNPTGFFQDDNGKNSPLRAGSFAALIAAVLLGWLTIGGNATAAEAELTYGLLAAAFGTKTVNKFSTSRV
jgi:hypothetical protein